MKIFAREPLFRGHNHGLLLNSYTLSSRGKQPERKIFFPLIFNSSASTLNRSEEKALHTTNCPVLSVKKIRIFSAIGICVGLFNLILNLGMFSTVLPIAQAATPITPLMAVDASTIYGCHIDHDKVIDLAQSLEDTGLLKAGYNLIEINDCWQKRDSAGNIVPDSTKFPHGMAALASELHSKGIKFGLSLDITRNTCAHSVGSVGHIFADTTAVASWGIDELSVSACDTHVQDILKANCSTSKGSLFLNPLFEQVLTALGHSGRNISVTSMLPANIAAACGDQNTAYIQAMDFATHHVASWISLPPPTSNWDGFLDSYSNAIANLQYQHQGGFGAASYLSVGQGFLNNDEEKIQLALWAICAAPLILATNPARLNDAEKTLLSNPDIIRLDQTSLHFGSAYQLVTNDSIDLLVRQTAPQSYMAMEFAKGGFFNSGSGVAIPWELPGNDWIQTDISTGNSTPLPTSLSDMGLGHHIVIYNITHSK